MKALFVQPLGDTRPRDCHNYVLVSGYSRLWGCLLRCANKVYASAIFVRYGATRPNDQNTVVMKIELAVVEAVYDTTVKTVDP